MTSILTPAKNRISLLLLAIFSFFALTEQAQAQDQKPVAFKAPPNTRVIRTLDVDKDGQLSAEEIAAATTALKSLDRDESGELSLRELGGPGPIMGMLRNQLIIRVLDVNGDLKLSSLEIENAPALLKKLDRDNNGHLSERDLSYERTLDPGYDAIPTRPKILMNEYVPELEGEVMPGYDPRVDKGYMLVQETSSFNDVQMGRHTYLLDENARLRHAWYNANYAPEGSSAHLLDNGILVRSGSKSDWLHREQYPVGAHGTIELVDWEANTLWSYTLDQPGRSVLHHDFEVMPNGNLLVTAYIGFKLEEAIAIGFNPLLANGDIVWFESIIELIVDSESNQPKLAWQWNSWDHVIQDDFKDLPNYGSIRANRDRIDINATALKTLPYNAGEIHHINSLSYNEALDQIVLSSAATGEIWVIDHSTTRAEAATDKGGNAGKGGRILYRWGNPAMLGGSEKDRMLFWQHDAQWTKPDSTGKSNILIYNTGLRRAPNGSYDADQPQLGIDQGYTDIIEITPPVDEAGAYDLSQPPTLVWGWNIGGDLDFYSPFSGGVSRTPNGHTMIVQSARKRVVELTPEGERVLDFRIPGPGRIFNLVKLSPDHSGLAILGVNQNQ